MRLILVFISIFSFHYNSYSQCNPPSNIQSEMIDSTSIRISWDFQEGVDYYRIRYKKIGSPSWSLLSNPTNIDGSYTEREVFNLDIGEEYVFNIKSWCNNGLNSNWYNLGVVNTTVIVGCKDSLAFNYQQSALYNNPELCFYSCYRKNKETELINNIIYHSDVSPANDDTIKYLFTDNDENIYLASFFIHNDFGSNSFSIDDMNFEYQSQDVVLKQFNIGVFKLNSNGDLLHHVMGKWTGENAPQDIRILDIEKTNNGLIMVANIGHDGSSSFNSSFWIGNHEIPLALGYPNYLIYFNNNLEVEWHLPISSIISSSEILYNDGQVVSSALWDNYYSGGDYFELDIVNNKAYCLYDPNSAWFLGYNNEVFEWLDNNSSGISHTQDLILGNYSIEFDFNIDKGIFFSIDLDDGIFENVLKLDSNFSFLNTSSNNWTMYDSQNNFFVNNQSVSFIDNDTIINISHNGVFQSKNYCSNILSKNLVFNESEYFTFLDSTLYKLNLSFEILDSINFDLDINDIFIDQYQMDLFVDLGSVFAGVNNMQEIERFPAFDFYSKDDIYILSTNEKHEQLFPVNHQMISLSKYSRVRPFFDVHDITCSNFNDGSISISVNDGFSPFQYDWSTGATTPNITNLDTGLFHLTVIDSLGCVSSDSVRVELRDPPANDMYPQICNVSVDDLTGKNKIKVTNLTDSLLLGYGIFKEVSTDIFTQIATIDYTQEEYIDETSTPLVNANRYKIAAIDVCTNESDLSPAHKTVHLTMNEGVNGEVNLIWNPYEGFTVSNYLIYRSIDGGQMSFIGFVAGNIYSYTDLTPPSGILNYEVRMIAEVCPPIVSNPLFNVALIADTIKSNIITHENIDYLGVNLIANNPSCATCTDGSVIAFAYGGSAPYNYTWINGVFSSLNLNLGIGTYTVYVSDNQGNIVSETITLTAESSDILGCTDQSATNYDAAATEDDGSCEYPVVDNPCDITPSGLFVDNIIHERVAFNWSAPSSAPSYYMIRYRPVGTNGWIVMSAGSQNDVPFTGTTRTRYFMEPGTTYQWNIRARVVDENGATVCQSPWSASHQYTTLPACANLTDLSVNPEANLVYFNANKPSGDWGVWQAKGKIREVGSNNYRYLATTVDSYTNQIKYNFTPSTDYEWHTKAWCTGNVDEDGNSDPQYHSGWGEFSAFTTQDPCDKLPTNLSTTSGNNANTAITMSWDTPISGQPHHYFLELTNETTGQVFSWNNLAGSSTSKTKYGQSSGDQFKWRIRGACGENGTSWATSFTGYEYYTLGGDRLGNDSQLNSLLNNISVYPNPSRGEFNISFDLESRQDVYLSITNYLGEVVFTEELKDQEGQYNKTINLGNKANGIYMLNITTNNQNINQKIVIQ